MIWRTILGSLLIAGVATPAAAEPTVTLAEARDAVAIYDEGKARQAEGDFEAAYLLFREADAQYPGSLPKYRVAVCLDALGRSREAAEAYRAFLASKPAAKHAELAAMARARLAALRQLKPGERVAASVARPKLKAVEAHRDVASVDEPDRLGLRIAGFVLLGAGVAGGAAFAATFAQSRIADDSADRDNAGTAATVLAPVTAALVLGAAIVLPLGYRESEQTARVTPYVGPASAGLVASF